MKTLFLLVLTVAAGLCSGLVITRVWAAEEKGFQTFEYGTIRWAGRDHTHFIRPNGQVEPLGTILSKVKRPDRTDERAYLMNIAMNAVAMSG